MVDPGSGETDRDTTAGEVLPLFPLSNVVLFPHIQIPLYVFEPRYREMTESALTGDRLIGMVTVLRDQRSAMAGDPDIYPIGCAGYIESFERRDDGSFDIVLEGRFCFEILQELEKPGTRQFREARVRKIVDDDAEAEPTRAASLRDQVHQRYGELLEIVAPQYVEQFRAQAFTTIPNAVYANTISLSLEIEAIEKQSLLESPNTLARLEQILAVLDFKLAEVRSRAPEKPATIQ